MATLSSIYAYLFDRAAPCTLTSAWSQFAATSEVRCSTSATIKDVRAKFRDKDLLSAGVLAPVAKGQCDLHTALRGDNVALVAIKKSRRTKPHALLAGGHALGDRSLPLVVALTDHALRQRIADNGNRLFVSFSASDDTIFRSLEFPVAPSNALEKLSGQDLTHCCRALDLPRRFSDDLTPTAKIVDPIYPTLVGWSVSDLTLKAPSRLEAIRRHLIDLHQQLEFPADAWSIWQASERTIDRLRYALAYGEATDQLEIIAESARVECRPVLPPPIEHRLSYMELRQQLIERSAVQAPKSEIVGKLRNQLAAEQSKLLIQPLFDVVQTAANPIQRNIGITLTQLFELAHQQSLTLSVARTYSAKFGASPGKSSREDFIEWMATIDQAKALAQIYQALSGQQQNLGRLSTVQSSRALDFRLLK